MIFSPLPLAGAVSIDIDPREDARGMFARLYCDDEFAAQGLNTTWVQMNISVNTHAGTLRGLHFQRPPADEIKLVRCLRGMALDVIVDLRRDSDTFGRHTAVTLDGARRNAIYIPKGFAHGFQTLQDGSELQYLHSTAYAPGHEGGINPLDPALGIDWPQPPVQMSDRDRDLPPLKECDPL